MNTPYTNYLISELRSTDWTKSEAVTHLLQVLDLGLTSAGFPVMQQLLHSLLTLEQHKTLLRSRSPHRHPTTIVTMTFPPTTDSTVIWLFTHKHVSIQGTFKGMSLPDLIHKLRDGLESDTYRIYVLTAWIWYHIFPTVICTPTQLHRLSGYIRINSTPTSFLSSPLEPILQDLRDAQTDLVATLQRFKPFLFKDMP